MASNIPLNTFKSLTANVYTTVVPVYTTPVGVSTVILMAQFANLGDHIGNVSMSFLQNGANFPTVLVRKFDIPPDDAGNVLTGRLILEQGDSLNISAGANNLFQFTLSYLETANA
jgi:hypothetical protein